MKHLHQRTLARSGAALLVLAMAAAGCATPPSGAEAPASRAGAPSPGGSAPAPGGAPAAEGGKPASEAGTPTPVTPKGEEPGVPAENEICLKPANGSGVQFHLYKPAGDSTFRAEAGWSIARPAYQLVGGVVFPSAVDPESVKISLSPEGWTAMPQSAVNLPPHMALFNFVPEGTAPESLAWGEPGWLTLTVEGAQGPDGQPLQTEPATLRIFAYSQEMQESHPYLGQCYSSLGVSPGPNGP